MRRFFIDSIKAKGGIVRVGPPESGHIARVLRMASGDRLVLMDGTGARYQAIIQSSRPDEVELFLEHSLPAPPGSPLETTLCASLLKSGPMDVLIQKTSEMGVTRIQPFVSSRTVVRLNKDRVSNRMRHWKEVATNAAKQADRDVPAEVAPPASFEELLAGFKDSPGLKLFLWEGEDTEDLRGVLRNSKPPQEVIAVVGPEGGFSPGEVENAVSAGFESVSLGRRILRAETAALALVALLQYEWGDLSIRK